MALSNVVHSINSPDNSPFSDSVLPVFTYIGFCCISGFCCLGISVFVAVVVSNVFVGFVCVCAYVYACVHVCVCVCLERGPCVWDLLGPFYISL